MWPMGRWRYNQCDHQLEWRKQLECDATVQVRRKATENLCELLLGPPEPGLVGSLVRPLASEPS